MLIENGEDIRAWAIQRGGRINIHLIFEQRSSADLALRMLHERGERTARIVEVTVRVSQDAA